MAGSIVSGHFARLRERFSGRWKSDATATALANDFLAEQQAEREKWLTMWQKTAGDAADRAAADRAVSWLQMFDAMSLWLCCAERRGPQEFAPPGGPALTLQPTTGPYSISVSPWPFLAGELEVAALGRAIAVRPYADPSDVVTAAAQPVTLKWSLTPQGGWAS
ncbi:MAG: hypothetical protein B7Z73_04620 [Planctomycetia bacterium 21-64-5]|nr:MAG: hypothetical protein B7Z73_04620 [Planctomycetia bacterium 21-64-5]